MLKKEREAVLHKAHLASPLKGARAAAQVPALGREGKGGGLESLSIPSPNYSISVGKRDRSKPHPFTF